jgi:putative tryptophan/tyrosine transport system substrate-binding protein
MRRRNFVTVLLLVATTGRAEVQQPAKVYRLAVDVPATPVTELSKKTASHPAFRAFFEELPRLGYVEGRNLAIERFSGEGRAEYYPELACDVV